MERHGDDCGEHPTRDIPKVGEALSSSHVVRWYVLRARYRAEQGLLEYSGFDCDYVGNRDKVLSEMEVVRDRIREIRLAMDRRGRGDARGRRAMKGQ